MSFETPILIIAFNRPEKIRLIFNILKILKPKNLFISCDGPRANNYDDKKLCEQVRIITKNVNWKCKTLYKFSKNNKTCKINVIESIDWFFKHNKEGIKSRFFDYNSMFSEIFCNYHSRNAQLAIKLTINVESWSNDSSFNRIQHIKVRG